MYRDYENPAYLEKWYEELKAEYTKPGHIMTIEEKEDLEELKARINFAYQDQEYDENY